MKPWARVWTIGLCVLWIGSELDFALRPNAAALASPATGIALPRAFLLLSALWGATLPALAMWFLITRKAAFGPPPAA